MYWRIETLKREKNYFEWVELWGPLDTREGKLANKNNIATLIFLLALYSCSLGIWISLICRETTFRFLIFSHSFISQTFLYYYSSVSVWRAFLHQQLEASCCVGFSIWTAFFLTFFVYCISPEIHFFWAGPFLWLHSENREKMLGRMVKNFYPGHFDKNLNLDCLSVVDYLFLFCLLW